MSLNLEYRETLAELWQRHLAPKNGPRFASLFAGCGGSSLGYSAAGCEEVLAAERDDHAVATFRENHQGVAVFHGDITTMLPGELKKPIDFLDGSPPCQGFSTVGKRRIEDSRNSLFLSFARLLGEWQPRAFVMENVTGLVKGKIKTVYFPQIVNALASCGYNVSVYQVSAAYYGAPTNRHRVFFLGHKTKTLKPPTSSTPLLCVRDAIEDLIDVVQDMPQLDDSYGKLWARIPQRKSASYILKTKGFGGCVKPRWLRPGPTLVKMQGGKGFATIAHPLRARALSVAEMKRLQSFPDEFVLRGSYQEQAARIGNSVAPLVAHALGTMLMDEL